MRAENGDIWKATKTVLAKVHGNEKARRQVIEEGELVEFRFWSPANVRTRDAQYLTINEPEFLDGFRFIGKIFREVYSRNQNTTAEILDAKLYTEESPAGHAKGSE